MVQNRWQEKKLQIGMEKRAYGLRLTAWKKIQVNNVRHNLYIIDCVMLAESFTAVVIMVA